MRGRNCRLDERIFRIRRRIPAGTENSVDAKDGALNHNRSLPPAALSWTPSSLPLVVWTIWAERRRGGQVNGRMSGERSTRRVEARRAPTVQRVVLLRPALDHSAARRPDLAAKRPIELPIPRSASAPLR